MSQACHRHKKPYCSQHFSHAGRSLQDDLVDEVADIDTIPNEKKQHQVTAAISNSFGFGGHNSVVCFAPFKG